MFSILKLDNTEIGNANSVFIIAEIGINHGGDAGLCAELIREAVNAGADAVKLQTVNPDESYVKGTASFNEYKFKQLDDSAMNDLLMLSKNLGVVLFSTPGDFDSLNRMVWWGMPAIKISSGLMTNYPLIARASQTGLPLIISTGMALKEEIHRVLDTIEKNGGSQVALLKCTSIYPSPDHLVNLNAIETMMEEFNVPIGYSDHTIDDLACLGAVAKGAVIIEKHFTLDKSLPGADHAISMEPRDFKFMVEKIRRIAKMRGSIKIGATEEEMLVRNDRRRSLVARLDIRKGEIFSHENIGLMRTFPGLKGLTTDNYEILLGKKAIRFIKKFDPINQTDFE